MSHERSGSEQLELVLDRLWGEVLPTVQPQADGAGFGPEWRAMCETGTASAALAAAQARRWRPRRRQRQPGRRARASNWPTWVAAAAQVHEAAGLGEAGRPAASRRLESAPACRLERVLEHPAGRRNPRSYRSPGEGKSPLRGSEGLPVGLSGRSKARNRRSGAGETRQTGERRPRGQSRRR